MALDSDVLASMVDYEAILPMARSAGGHDGQMQALFKGAKVLAHWNDGDYQGSVATAYRLSDGRFAWVQDSYGSCSGCDAWADAGDADVRDLCDAIARNARVFQTLDELHADMKGIADNQGAWWVDSAAALLKQLQSTAASTEQTQENAVLAKKGILENPNNALGKK